MEFRKDGKVHDYAVYYIHEDGSKSFGYVETLYALNPGETVQLGSQTIVIDFEL